MRNYLDGILKAGISFGLLNLIIFCVLYASWVRFGVLAYMVSDIWQNPGSANSIYIQILVLLLVAAICMLAMFILTTLAGAMSARINRITDDSDALTNGKMTGTVMWIITGMAGILVFTRFCMFIIEGTLRLSNYIDPSGSVKIFQILIIILVWVHLLTPILITLWVFMKFSSTGSQIYRIMSSHPAIPAGDPVDVFKESLATWGRPWAKTTAIVMALIWPIIFYYLIIIWIFSLH